jgi:hypothetical protein
MSLTVRSYIPKLEICAFANTPIKSTHSSTILFPQTAQCSYSQQIFAVRFTPPLSRYRRLQRQVFDNLIPHVSPVLQIAIMIVIMISHYKTIVSLKLKKWVVRGLPLCPFSSVGFQPLQRYRCRNGRLSCHYCSLIQELSISDFFKYLIFGCREICIQCVLYHGPFSSFPFATSQSHQS